MAAKNLLKYFEPNIKYQIANDPFMKIQDFQEFNTVPASRFNEINNYQKIIRDNMPNKLNAYSKKNMNNFEIQHYEIDQHGNLNPVDFKKPKKQYLEDNMNYMPDFQMNNQFNSHELNFTDLNDFLNQKKPQKEVKKDFFSYGDNQFKPLPKYEPQHKIQPQFNSKTDNKKITNMNSWEETTSKFAFKFLNDFRKVNGIKALKWDQNVYNVSRPHNLYMAKLKNISHDGFDNRANQLEKMFRVWQSAENVAYFMTWEQMTESDVARKLTDQWINSAGHRINMLLPDITHGAVSIIQTGSGGVYYYGTQFFIRK